MNFQLLTLSATETASFLDIPSYHVLLNACTYIYSIYFYMKSCEKCECVQFVWDLVEFQSCDPEQLDRNM